MGNYDLKNKINILQEFQYSVNIGFDMYNNDKINGFIPTTASMKIIEDLMLSTFDNSTDRARILIGAYGKGKSHIILVFLSLLYKKDIKLFTNVLEYMKNYNIQLYNYVIDYINSEKKILPVIVEGHANSLTEAFLVALKRSLEMEGLEDLMPETNFKAAVSRIHEWKKEYNSTYREFVSLINEPISEFIEKLMNFNVDTYKKFVNLYPSLTAGSVFNPFLGFNVVDMYTNIVSKLKDKGYLGVFVVYDEFSKYLETSITNVGFTDIKLLQDFAEKCNRSKQDQMHLLLISHKDISNYIDKLPKQKIDGWKGVSERFKHLEVNNNYYQIYEIMSKVMKKDNKFFSEFYEANKEKFCDMERYLKKTDIFSELTDDKMEIVIKGCYPLHPISAFILPRLSEKVAQNERTLFTFLSSRNKNTLSDFLNQQNGLFPLLTPDYIYDYFEPLFRRESYTSETYKIYNIATNILNRFEQNSLSRKIIKTISLIYMIEQFEKLPPIPDVIINTYKYLVNDISEITECIFELQEKQYVIYMKKSNKYLKLKNSLGIDIGSKIAHTIEKIRTIYSVKDILNNVLFDNYMYPTRYNDENEIIRYFSFTFIDYKEFLSVIDWNKKIEDICADGVIYGIITSNKEEINIVLEHLENGFGSHDRIVFVIIDNPYDIEKIAYEYQAVLKLKEQANEDELLIEEYNIYIEDIEEVLKQFIAYYIKPEIRRALYYYKGAKKTIYRKAHISHLLSNICSSIFTDTPIINNESINKNILSPVAVNSRSKVINGLLSNKLEPLLGLHGNGQEVSILRSTLVMTGILNDFDTKPQLVLHGNENLKMQKVLDEISNFFKETSHNGPTSFAKLYERLTKPEHHIGMKKGVIPIYIAAVLHSFKRYAVIMRENKELEINAQLLNSINENPQQYYFHLEKWDNANSEYISRMEEIFHDNIIEKEKEYNNFSYIMKAMQRWFIGLPKYAKEMKLIYEGNGKSKEIDKEILKFINSLKVNEINSYEYLFNKLFNIFNLSPINMDIIDKVRTAKDLLDSSKDRLIDRLINDVCLIFRKDQPDEASLSSIIKDWYETLQEGTKNHLFNMGEERVLQLMKTINNDDKLFIEKLSKLLTGIRIDDWEDGTISTFINAIKSFKENVEKQDNDFYYKDSDSYTNIYKITCIDSDGREDVKTFKREEYSDKAKLMLNEILSTLDEYGYAITISEKRQVLMEIIEKLC